MFSKLSLSLAAAIALSAAAGGVARAAPIPTSSEEGRAMAHSPTSDDSVAVETGNAATPDSRDRVIGRHSPTNDEINAAETGNPDSIDNKDQQSLPPDGNWKADWQSLDSGSPDKP